MEREEAIEVYNGLINTKIKEAFEFFAPELRENEDERIRKDIINYILYKADGVSEEQEHSWVSYLEKQKEQKPVQDKEEKEYVRTLKSLIADFLRGKDEIDRRYYQKIYNWLDGRHIEQKPAEWSEKDKDYFDAIIAKLEITQDDALLTDNQINFLKSLPERFNLPPK